MAVHHDIWSAMRASPAPATVAQLAAAVGCSRSAVDMRMRHWMSSGFVDGTIFDPLVQGKLWQSAGVGVWETQLPSNFTWQTPVIWHSQSMGIEQLVANDIIAPAGGDPVFGSWDRAFFQMPDLAVQRLILVA